jgi:hypothetical protein
MLWKKFKLFFTQLFNSIVAFICFLFNDFISEVNGYERNYFNEAYDLLLESRKMFLLASDGCMYRNIGPTGIYKTPLNLCTHENMDSIKNPSCICNMRDCPQLLEMEKTK